MSIEAEFVLALCYLNLIMFGCHSALFLAGLKLYTEIMKEKAQRERKP